MIKSNVYIEHIAAQVVDAAYHVHKEMGPGLMESIYSHCLIHELQTRNLHVLKEVLVPLQYKNVILSKDFRLDILVEHEIIVEVKSVEILHPVYSAQLISYLKLTDKKIGFLINFNVPLIKSGIKRFVNKL